ncbi:histidine kinase : PAS domain S-box OS=Singulisphaera acidiphila (strain ATCC BAA-1392 / DSM 18658 / VKM B-2454 / MOB10) GN=Sinac_0766 PE=4 SV=1: PAS_4: GAF_2: HisKA: HATPase_c [Gemmata massiliana]|uniref:histidine kinase n=1 Tax=Gemmata massiliana TaxID=1210884 RepID=A0A6P2DAU6_9BACT|nr:ATP-binding protein [Gemmata massiliana]VTR97706.1 histidine kinase : PAS domain S-box OS=Singulisphaera acidiphila (strain ATCC BAA-1392 / DSM 18658 / VKM B-2454 / MOB10) GN=Sinac_0766 PE=4 SV=1: PAS_4: GAF_2: HisKA: HATPase_c [Gemmata massiliana]
MGLSAGLLNQLDAVGDWGLLATDTELTVTGWNRWLERQTGLAAEDVLGRKLFDLFPDLPARGLDRYFRQVLAGQTAILSQRFHSYILPIPTPIAGANQGRMQQSARILPLAAGANVLGTLTLVEDVTERVVRDAELRSRGRQQAALALSARAALAGHDIAALCSESVHQLADTVGADCAEVLEHQPNTTAWARLAGTGWSEAPGPIFQTAETAHVRAVLDSESAVLGEPEGASRFAADAYLRSQGIVSGFVVRIPGRGNQSFGLLGVYSRTPRRFTPDERQYVQALADIIGTAAERKQLDAELRLRVGELAEADRRKDEFLAMLAHELRNPLAPVRNAVQILQATYTHDPVVTRLAEMLGRQVGQMVHMVDDLLDVSRFTRGKVELRKELLVLADAVTRAVETARPLIDARHHAIEVSVPAEPIHLDADPTRLTQILGNLLNNAAKYTEDGGRIWLSAARNGDEAVVRVRDTGIGLAPEMLLRAFDLFTQESRTLDRAQGGLGIGLTLVRSLVELHGGTVRAFSDGPGLGSEFVACPRRRPVRRKPTSGAPRARRSNQHAGY